MGRKLKGKPSRSTSKNIKAALFRDAIAKNKKQATAAAKQVKSKSDATTTGTSSKKPQLVEQQNKIFIPFTPKDNVLLVGEGDFSFAVSCLKSEYLKPENLIVTSFDNSPNELSLKYPKTFPHNNEYLMENGVKILYKIDATDLVRSLRLNKNKNFQKIDYIVFNFPHTGRGMKDMDRNIRDHQLLVLGYFKSSVELFQNLSKSSAKEGDLNVIGKEPKEPKIVLSVFEGEPYDSWNIKSLSKTLNLKVERSGKFRWDAFKGYEHKRTNSEQNTTKIANERNARIYVFEKFKKQQKKKQTDEDEDSD